MIVGYCDHWASKLEPTALGGTTYYRELAHRLNDRRTIEFQYLNHEFANIFRPPGLNWKGIHALLSTIGQYSYMYYYFRDQPVTIIRDCHTVGWWGHILQELLCSPLTMPHDFTIFPSRYALSTYSRISSENVPKVVAYGIELPSSALIERFRQERRSGKTTLCYVGRLSYDKNFLSVIRAFLEVRKRGYEVRLVVAGPTVPRSLGPDIGLVRTFVEKAGATSDFEYLGYVPDEIKWRVLAESDVFLFPVTSAHESLCRTIVEAKYCGLAVVSTRFGPVPELIKDGENGLLVDVAPKKTKAFLSGGPIASFDFSGFVEALTDVLGNASLLDRLKRVPADVVEFYSMDNFLGRLEDLIMPCEQHRTVSLARPLKEYTDIFNPEFLEFVDTDLSPADLIRRAVNLTISAYEANRLLLGYSPPPEDLGIRIKDGFEEYLFPQH